MMIDETWYQPPAENILTRKAAGCVVFQRQKESLYVTLLQEGELGSWVLPKGGVEKQESPKQAAWRETSEEAGFLAHIVLNFVSTRSRWNLNKTKWVTTDYFIATTSEIQGFPTATERAFKQNWFKINELPECLWKEQYEVIQEAISMLHADSQLLKMIRSST